MEIQKREHQETVLERVLEHCRDKSNANRYNAFLLDDEFPSTPESINAFAQIMIEDDDPWGGDLTSVFLPTDYDEAYKKKYGYGVGIVTAYELAVNDINRTVPLNASISLINHFFKNRISPKQRIDPKCFFLLKITLASLLERVTNEEKAQQYLDVLQSLKDTIPCSVWSDFFIFLPYCEQFMKKNDLINRTEKHF